MTCQRSPTRHGHPSHRRAVRREAAGATTLPRVTVLPGDPARHLRLPGTRNLRDVGGYPAGPGRQTRWRTLLRTDALDQLPPASQEELIGLGLRRVIDLRWEHELAARPSVFERSERVRYTSLPLVPSTTIRNECAPSGSSRAKTTCL